MDLSTANLQSGARRAKLPSRHPYYWVGIGERGKCIGYRRAQERATGVWHARLYVEGRWVQSRLGLADDREEADGARVLTLLQAKEKALTWFVAARAEAEGRLQRRGKYMVSDAMDYYFAECRRGGEMKAANVYRQECSARAHINPALGNIAVESLTIGRIKQWMGDAARHPARKRSRKGAEIAYREEPDTEDHRRARRDTVNRVLSILKAALNLAVRDHKVPVANAFAWREVKPFGNAAKARTLFLSVEEQRDLVAACDDDFAELARAGLYCGARYGELREALVRNFDKTNATFNIAPEVAKNGKARHIQLDEEASRFFAGIASQRPADEPLFLRVSRNTSVALLENRTSVRRKWGPSEQARAMREACVKAFPFYTLRHSCAARWLAAGVPMTYVADQLGNSVAICAKYYAHVSKGHIAAVIRSVPPLGLNSLPVSQVARDLRRVK